MLVIGNNPLDTLLHGLNIALGYPEAYKEPEVNSDLKLDPFTVMDMWLGPLQHPQSSLSKRDYGLKIETVFESLDDCIAHLDIVAQMMSNQSIIGDRDVADPSVIRRTNLVELTGGSVRLSGDFSNVGYTLASRFDRLIKLRERMTDETKDLYMPYLMRTVGYIIYDALCIADVLINRN